MPPYSNLHMANSSPVHPPPAPNEFFPTELLHPTNRHTKINELRCTIQRLGMLMMQGCQTNQMLCHLLHKELLRKCHSQGHPHPSTLQKQPPRFHTLQGNCFSVPTPKAGLQTI